MLFSRIDRAYRRWRRTGDGRQLARVFDATANDLFRLGYHLLGDRHAAEDLVQQTFVVAIEQAVALADGRAVFPWLCGILTNRALHQRRQLRQRAGKGGSVDAAVDPVAEAHTRELQATIAVKVRALPEPYRQVLLLHLVHELAPQDIAEALARSPATVRTQLARGLDLLRKALPASLGIGAMAAVPLPIGLPAVRTAVLQHAQAVVGQGAFMVGGGVALLGGMAMKKALVALLVAVFVVATWSFWDGEQAALPPVATTSSQQGQPTRQGMPGSVAETASAASQRTSAPIPADAPASLAVEVAWHDGTPAADIAVRVTPDRQVGALWLDVERTDCGGIARFAAQTPGVVHVRCDRGTAAKVEVIAGKAASVQLTIARGIDVRGRVVDTEEKPVVGASVWLSVVPNSDETELAATSGSDGTFTLRSVGLNHVLSATTPGRGCAKCAFVRESSATEELVVAVRSVPGMLVGSVVDDRGKPVAGARVLVGVQRTESSEPEHKRLLGEVTGADVWPARFVRSDADGSFRIDGLPPWPWPVWIGARGFGPLLRIVDIVDRGETNATFMLEAPAVVTGTVRDANGEPVAGASIGAHPKLPAVDARITLGMPLSAGVPKWVANHSETDAEGHYMICGVLPGTLHLGAWRGDDEARDEERAITSGETLEWSPTLTPWAKFEATGTLVDSAGQVVSGFDVLYAYTDHPLNVGRLSEESFHLRLASDVPFRVAVKRSHPDAGRLVPLGEFRIADSPLRLVVPETARRGASLRGRLLRDDGSPLVMAQVNVMSRDRRVFAYPSLDRDGSFRSGEVDPGSYDVQVQSAIGSYGVGTFDLRAGELLDLGDIKPPPLGDLVVTVVDRAGHRRPDIWLRVRSRGSDRMAGWDAKHHESVTRGTLPAGRYSLQTWDGPMAAMDIEVVAGRTLEVRFVVPDVVPFVLRLPAKTGEVELLRHEWRCGEQLVSSDHGTLADRIRDERRSAPPGRYTVEVRDPDGSLATATFELLATDPPPVFELPMPRR